MPTASNPLVRRVGAACLLVAALALSACSSGGDDAKEETELGSAEQVDRTTTTAAPTTTAAATTTLPPTTGAPSPGEAAQKLYDSWKVGDKAAAAAVATPDAVNGIWATVPGDYAVYNQCDTGEFSTSGCLFRGNSGTIQFTMEKRPTGFVVIEALFSPP